MVNKRAVVDDGEEAERLAKKIAKKDKAIPNFYQSQAATQRKNRTFIVLATIPYVLLELDDLRQKFEEDRKRIEELKRSKLLQ